MRDFYYPQPVYNALPYLYVAVGVATILWLGNVMAWVSGLALISAGLTVWTLRLRYRRAARQRRSKARQPARRGHGRHAGELGKVAWRRHYECGHPILDMQHRRLIATGNELIAAVQRNDSPSDLEWMLNDIIDHITDHFCTEEALLAKTRHPIGAEHQRQHRALLDKAEALRSRFVDRQVDARDVVGFITHDLLLNHIAKDDRKFAAAPEPAPTMPAFRPSTV